MTRARSTLGSTVVLATVAALTTWVSMLSWRGFTDQPRSFVVPLLVVALLVAAVGATGRWARLGPASVLLLQLLVAGMATSYAISGSPLPVGAAWGETTAAFRLAVDGANTYAPPVPSAEASVDPLLLAGGLGCLLLVDLLACSLRRASLAGIPLLTVYSVPVSLLGTDLTWWVFGLSALGFVTLIFLQESEQVSRWGRDLGGDVAGDLRGSSIGGIRTAGLRLRAVAVGSTATALAVVVPLAIPTLDVHLFGIGRGPGGGSDVTIENPMADLRRDLQRTDDVPLLRVRTDDPDPSYLRISVLNRFSGNEWSSGDRQIPTDNRADGAMPALTGVDASVPRQTFDYDVDVLDDFHSTWLPTWAPIRSIQATGDWRYDVSTMDFLATEDDLDTAGMRYSMTGIDLDLTAQKLAEAPSSAGMVSAEFTDLPSGMDPLIRQLANDVTADAPTRFQKAVALQDWFRANFTYSLENVDPGNGTDELVAFLSDEPGGRTGYCEQFAAAMAVMARQLGIPARVAVGFLKGDEVSPGEWEFSSFDLHAWPELFIAGSGWVRFEPTPADRASGVPSYTEQAVRPDDPATSAAPTGRADDQLPQRGDQATDQPSDRARPEQQDAAGGDQGSDHRVWLGIGGGLLGVLLLAGLALLPRSLRRRRRAARLAGGPEDVWAELRDTARDLRVPWPDGRSPRRTASVLREHLGDPDDDRERPVLGAAQAPEAAAGLDHVVESLERLRYSRAGSGARGQLEGDGLAVVAALEAGAPRSARRRAAWLPRTALRRSPRATISHQEVTYEERVVDHVR